MSENSKPKYEIEELTEAQKAKLPEYLQKWTSIGVNTDPCDFEKAKAAIIDLYKVCDLTPPTYFIGPVNNPYEGALAEQILNRYKDEQVGFESPEQLNEMVLKEIAEIVKEPKARKGCSISNQIYGSMEYWLSYYDFFQAECGLKLPVDAHIALSKVCGWWTPLKNIAILQHRPLEIHRDAENRTHNETGPAIKFRGSAHCDVYVVHGVRVPKKVVDRDYTAQDIQKESNVEVRRIMLDFYGSEKYITDIGAKEVHTDDFGTLYKAEFSDDEALMMVKVVNSTVEPDGTYKNYWIRVDPKAYGGLKTARAAVASTWRRKDGSLVFATPEEYDCDIET